MTLIDLDAAIAAANAIGFKDNPDSVAYDVADALRALPAVQPDPLGADGMKPLIPPLIWEGNSDTERSRDYTISPSYSQGPAPWMLARGSKLLGWYAEKWVAKVAAQGNHEAFIWASIDCSQLRTIDPITDGHSDGEYRLSPQAQAVLDASKKAPQWDTKRDRMRTITETNHD